MSTLLEMSSATVPQTGRPRPRRLPRPGNVLRNWVRGQPINLLRHARELAPFTRAQFGSGPAAPSESHIQAVNALLDRLRRPILAQARRLRRSVEDSANEDPPRLQQVVTDKERGHSQVMALEKIWDHYNELFSQRQRSEGTMLLACDRIAQDCYQYVYLGLGTARSIPTPAPFSYMRTGFSPATYRRGIPLTRLGRQLNPFPLVQLPFHRLVNPWTLGAILHEVAHNIQTDVGLSRSVPARIRSVLTEAGLPPSVARTYAKWNREMFADMCALFWGGPAIVGSLMDVVGRSPRATYFYLPGKPHPVPYLRSLLNTAQLRRMGFVAEADAYERGWKKIYTNPQSGNIPPAVLETLEPARRLVIEAVCFRPFAELGNKSLAQVIRFDAKEQLMVEEAAGRIATGIDPGIIPERFLIGAARLAFIRGLARPRAIAEAFYRQLAKR